MTSNLLTRAPEVPKRVSTLIGKLTLRFKQIPSELRIVGVTTVFVVSTTGFSVSAIISS